MYYNSLEDRFEHDQPHRRQDAIRHNIEVLADILAQATQRTAEGATRAANDVNMNGAIGTLFSVEQQLETALVLIKAAFALHKA